MLVVVDGMFLKLQVTMATNGSDVHPNDDAQSGNHLEAVNRISKIPVVESTIQTATSLYEKVKVSLLWQFLYTQK